MIYQHVTQDNFINAFRSMRPDSFTYEALVALYDYHSELDINIELDIIAIDCEWTEYDSLADVQAEYSDSVDLSTIDKLRDYATLLELDNGHMVMTAF